MSDPRRDIAKGLRRLLERAGGVGFEDKGIPPALASAAG